jgi:hypothetical protein
MVLPRWKSRRAGKIGVNGSALAWPMMEPRWTPPEGSHALCGKVASAMEWKSANKFYSISKSLTEWLQELGVKNQSDTCTVGRRSVSKDSILGPKKHGIEPHFDSNIFHTPKNWLAIMSGVLYKFMHLLTMFNPITCSCNHTIVASSTMFENIYVTVRMGNQLFREITI